MAERKQVDWESVERAENMKILQRLLQAFIVFIFFGIVLSAGWMLYIIWWFLGGLR